MFDKLNLYRVVCFLTLLFSAAPVAAIYFIDFTYFYMWAAIWVVVAIIVIVTTHLISRNNHKFYNTVRNAIFGIQREALTKFPLPTLIVRENGEIIWENELFVDSVFDGEEHFATDVTDMIPSIDFTMERFPEGYNVLLNKKQYTCYVVRSQKDEETALMLYFVDDHYLKTYTKEFFDSRPWVLLVLVDNYSELFANTKENERGKIMGDIESIVEDFAESKQGLLRRLDKDKYLVVIEERYMKAVMNERFEILEDVKNVETGGRMPATISIGAAMKEGSLHESEAMARVALDMALGRGGDQVAVKTKTGYEFFGGISKGVEKRTKVRTRIVASALNEMVEQSSNVLIMGHKYSDLDSLGSSVGVCSALKHVDKPVNIVLNTNTSLALPLYNHIIEEPGYKDIIISPEAALDFVSENTLLIIVDTHVKSLVESQEIFERCKSVVVIDHHRKKVDHIDNALIFYHEPNASSASEMAAELVQYLMEKPKISKREAEAMLSGVMLDTKSFSIGTGVRTFEAAAFLKKMSADTIEVRKLFSSSLDNYRNKSKIISGAETYRHCAVAITNETFDDMRIVVAQAADELLNVNDVLASFVFYNTNGITNISARSLGKVNVQVIMEKMGGGGHQMMAAVQLQDTSLEMAKQQVLLAIDNYIEENMNINKS